MKLKMTLVPLSLTGFIQAQQFEIGETSLREDSELARALNVYLSKSVDPRSLWQQANMLSKLLNSKFPTVSTAWDYLMQYGCYCHQVGEKMPTSKLGYHGPALDELDELCRKSYRAQKCLENEFEREFDMADPISLKYPWYLNNTTNEIICNLEKFPNWANKKSNQFRLKNCEIEKEFVLEVIDLIENKGYERNMDFHNLGTNRYRKVCKYDTPLNPRNLYDNKECCGVGLTRKPYDSVLAQCCGNEIVNLGSC